MNLSRQGQERVCRLVLMTDTVKGTTKNKNINDVNPEIADEAVYEIGERLADLQTVPLFAIKCVETATLDNEE